MKVSWLIRKVIDFFFLNLFDYRNLWLYQNQQIQPFYSWNEGVPSIQPQLSPCSFRRSSVWSQPIRNTWNEHWGRVVSARHLSYDVIPHNSLTSRCYLSSLYGFCIWHFFLWSSALEVTLMPMERGSIQPCRSCNQILMLYRVPIQVQCDSCDL